tara:strand:+ start:210 stop:383 length:174 start_codon:yes stop_codon:yes gene_type:complete
VVTAVREVIIVGLVLIVQKSKNKLIRLGTGSLDLAAEASLFALIVVRLVTTGVLAGT